MKLELQRRSLEGELQRSRLGLSDREAQAQVLQDRVDSLQRQVGPFPSLFPAQAQCHHSHLTDRQMEALPNRWQGQS